MKVGMQKYYSRSISRNRFCSRTQVHLISKKIDISQMDFGCPEFKTITALLADGVGYIEYPSFCFECHA